MCKVFKRKKENQAYDVDNGLLLSPNIDSYFDKHDISFDENGKILLGNRVDDDIKKIYTGFVLDNQIMNAKRKEYMKIHRRIFNEKQLKTK